MNEKCSEYLCEIYVMYVMRSKITIKNQRNISLKTYKNLQNSIAFIPSLMIDNNFPIFLIIIQMQTPQLYRYELVQSFLSSIRSAQSKQEFLTRVQEFDTRFTEEQPAHAYSEKQKSTEKLPPMPQEKPKNPFRANLEENYRQHSFIQPAQTVQNSPFSQQQPQVRGGYSRTQQNFYKNQAGKNEQYSQMNSSFGYGVANPQGGHAQNQGASMAQGNYQGGGTGVLGYNAYGQKQYEELRQQFFRAPPGRPDHFARVQESYRQQGGYNFNPLSSGLGISSSTELLGEASSNKPSAKYGEKVNPFARQ